MCVGSYANQLNSNANLAAFAYYRAFDNGIDVQGLSDVWYGRACVFETHYRRAGNDAELVDAGEASDQSLGNAVGKVILCCVTRQVFQREDCEGLNGGLRRPLRGAVVED